MKKLLLISSLILLYSNGGQTQGCVPVRQFAGVGTHLLFENIQPSDKWLLNIQNRYLEGSSTYRGKEFISDKLVMNKIYVLDIGVIRVLNNGWSMALNVPISNNSRTNSLDHGGPQTTKYTTRSFGLGDVKLTVFKWILDQNSAGNIQAGLGLKLPTGDYRYQDYFIRNDSLKVLGPVDQAIQLGDGGTGITTELSAYYSLNKIINLFAQGFYLINPREQNSVSNLKGRTASALEIRNTSTVMSVPDQYSIRAGANFNYRAIVLTAGLRFEGVPAEDLIGGSNGFRRAASIASFEPGLSYKLKNSLLYVSVAIPFERRSIQTIPDKITSDVTGNYTIYQGGFANYLLFAGVSIKLY